MTIQKHNGTDVRELVCSDKFQRALSQAATRYIPAKRMVKLAMLAMQRQPKLLQCSAQSVLASILTCQQLGLDCSGTLGSAWLVPYYNKNTRSLECQTIIGYRGLIDLARRSGDVKSLDARVVYAEDTFEVALGTDGYIKHVPAWDADRRDEHIIAAYAVATFNSGDKQFDVMTRPEIDGVRRGLKAADSGPWVTHYPEMARKTVTRRLIKYLPLSVEVAEQIATVDEDADHGVVLEIAEGAEATDQAGRAGQEAGGTPAPPEGQAGETPAPPTPAPPTPAPPTPAPQETEGGAGQSQSQTDRVKQRIRAAQGRNGGDQ